VRVGGPRLSDMMRQIDLRGRAADSRVDYAALLPRAAFDVAAAVEVVRPLCEAVRDRGEAALIEQTERFDGVAMARVKVEPRHLGAALERLSPDVRVSIEQSIDRLRATCAAELPAEVVTEVAPGTSVWTRNVPVGRVGLYVPAGQAPLVSSVVMNVVPAQVAGVESLALASPPQRDFAGLPHPSVLAACALLGVEEVYSAGGAGAVAMFAYGYAADDGGCEPVDLVTGPANIYGVAAKRLLRGVVGIDSEAGPTEIAILADDTADAAFVAADLVSQAEHDPMAAAVLVTESTQLVAAVEAELARLVPATKHAERVTAALTGRQSAVVLVDDTDAAIAVVNAYAPEHLEIHTRDADARAGQIRNAGAVFVGAYSPVSLGDYCAGSNHVLPTGGCARFSAGLSVRSFVKTMQVVKCSRDALAAVSPAVTTLADAEDLPAHGDAVRIRLAR
jgi:histidinol dehydrogenase